MYVYHPCSVQYGSRNSHWQSIIVRWCWPTSFGFSVLRVRPIFLLRLVFPPSKILLLLWKHNGPRYNSSHIVIIYSTCSILHWPRFIYGFILLEIKLCLHHYLRESRNHCARSRTQVQLNIIINDYNLFFNYEDWMTAC